MRKDSYAKGLLRKRTEIGIERVGNESLGSCGPQRHISGRFAFSSSTPFYCESDQIIGCEHDVAFEQILFVLLVQFFKWHRRASDFVRLRIRFHLLNISSAVKGTLKLNNFRCLSTFNYGIKKINLIFTNSPSFWLKPILEKGVHIKVLAGGFLWIYGFMVIKSTTIIS